MRHAKILATLGPASWDEKTISNLISAGVNAFRLNFSHSNHAQHKTTAERIRKIAKSQNAEICILQDLQGPKIRIGEMADNITIENGSEITLDNNPATGDANRVCLPHPEIIETLETGDLIYINDGIIRVKVTAKNKNSLTCKVVSGGSLTSRKGVNIPGREIPLTPLTPKDLKDLNFGQKLDIDWLALSFVQRAEDIISARKLLTQNTAIMAKIETTAAVENIESIIAETDGIMIARGDLGVELPPEEVPPLQKKIIRLCRKAGKPVVVATQMLESMITNPSPTRAEVSDVANATYEGADCLMLSAETAAGHNPVAVVEIMHNIIERVENSSAWAPLIDARMPDATPTIQDAITAAACHTAETIDACAIVTFTESGSTALRVARWRPERPIVCLTASHSIARRMGLVWGITSVSVPTLESSDHLVTLAAGVTKDLGIGESEEEIVVTAGVPFGKSGTTNMLRVVEID